VYRSAKEPKSGEEGMLLNRLGGRRVGEGVQRGTENEKCRDVWGGDRAKESGRTKRGNGLKKKKKKKEARRQTDKERTGQGNPEAFSGKDKKVPGEEEEENENLFRELVGDI